MKSYEYEKSHYVQVTPEEIKNADVRKSNSAEIVHFVEESQINSIFCEQPYYLEPEKNAAKAFALLRHALANSDKFAVCQFVMQARELAIAKALVEQLTEPFDPKRYTNEYRQEINQKIQAKLKGKHIKNAKFRSPPR